MAPEKPPHRFALIGPQIVKKKSFFFFFPCPKPQLSFKLSPVSLPAMDLTYPLTSNTYPRRTGFILVKLSPLLSWEQMVSMACHALFSWMGMRYPRCMARSPNPDVHLTSNRVTVTSAGMTWGDTAAKFFLTFQGAQKYLSLVVITIVQSFHGMDEKKKKTQRVLFFFQSFSKHLLSTCYVPHCANCRGFYFFLILFFIGG